MQPPDILYTVLSRSICKSWGEKEQKTRFREYFQNWYSNAPLPCYCEYTVVPNTADWKRAGQLGYKMLSYLPKTNMLRKAARYCQKIGKERRTDWQKKKISFLFYKTKRKSRSSRSPQAADDGGKILKCSTWLYHLLTRGEMLISCSTGKGFLSFV